MWSAWQGSSIANIDTFAGGIYQEQSTGCGVAATYTKYYMAFGRVVASRAGAAGTNGTVTYFLADHLGSSTTTITGGVATHVKYWPFGAPRSGTPPQRGYTGQQREANSPIGAYYYHARFYSTTLGHFMSADPTQGGRNRYAYVRNNPLRLMDPSGLDSACLLPPVLHWIW